MKSKRKKYAAPHINQPHNLKFYGEKLFQYIILTKGNILNLQQNFIPGTPQHLIFSKLEMPKEHAPSQTSKQKACFS